MGSARLADRSGGQHAGARGIPAATGSAARRRPYRSGSVDGDRLRADDQRLSADAGVFQRRGLDPSALSGRRGDDLPLAGRRDLDQYGNDGRDQGAGHGALRDGTFHRLCHRPNSARRCRDRWPCTLRNWHRCNGGHRRPASCGLAPGARPRTSPAERALGRGADRAGRHGRRPGRRRPRTGVLFAAAGLCPGGGPDQLRGAGPAEHPDGRRNCPTVCDRLAVRQGLTRCRDDRRRLLLCCIGHSDGPVDR